MTALLGVDELQVEFPDRRVRGTVRAVDGVSFAAHAGETVGLVGESGSGKTTIGAAIVGLVPISEGRVTFGGDDITHAPHRLRRRLATSIQVVFQDPYGSLNPTRTIGQTLAESVRVLGHLSKDEVRERTAGLLERVGLPSDAARRYPAHFSGGQRQRIAIARALMGQPRLVICDEPTSALDLSVQAQVLNLLRELQHELGLAYLFISHDLAVVRHVAHHIVVLYSGRIMEYGPATDVWANPTHPYTRALLDAVLVADPIEQRRRRSLRIREASTLEVASRGDSCPFAGRCPHTIQTCRTERPPLEPTPSGSVVACHRWQELKEPTHRGELKWAT